MDKIIVSVTGIGLTGFIWWFFFGKKEDAIVATSDTVDVVVEGGYKPENIKIKKGQKTTLSLLRKDPNSCLEEFILPDFKIKKYLPLNQRVEIEITPKQSGEFGFHCGMNMYHGKIVVD